MYGFTNPPQPFLRFVGGDFIRLTKRVKLMAETKKERIFSTAEFEIAVIKRIELINFMSHQHTVIEPSDGLTVLVGPNNCGKSAVVTALQILAHNDSSTYVLRHSEKHCRIIVETDDGHVIEWSRGKNKSPKYLLNGKLFDRLNGNVPPAVLEALRLPKVAHADSKQKFDIHFGIQKEPVFLVKDRERAAAEFFSASSDAGRLMEMQSLHRQKILHARKERTRFSTEARQLESDIEVLEPVAKLNKQLEECGRQAKTIESNERKIAKLEKAIRQIKTEVAEQTLCATKSKLLTELPTQPKYHDTKKLSELLKSLTSESKRFEKLQRRSNALAKMTAAPALAETASLLASIKALREQEQTLRRLTLRAKLLQELKTPPVVQDVSAIKEYVNQIESKIVLVEEGKSKSARLTQQMDSVVGTLEEKIKDNPLCPTCGAEVNSGSLLCHASSNAELEETNE